MAALDTETANLVMKHQETVILALRDPDISIRKRALDLLYGMCDRDNSKTIVSELLSYLTTADYAIREELVWTGDDQLNRVGFEDSHTCRKVCCALLLVRGRYSTVDCTGWRFCIR